ncbi:MAG: hypothetical protein HYV63_30455 [Candidatus Schekmanbacteria bacterium]|nr:hypothetical protein [Candidatus Schekmanbacteria bacterium]
MLLPVAARVGDLTAKPSGEQDRLRTIGNRQTRSFSVTIEPPALTAIKGIGAKTAAVLSERGIMTIQDLANAADDDLRGVPGVGFARMSQLRDAALAASGITEPVSAVVPIPPSPPAEQHLPAQPVPITTEVSAAPAPQRIASIQQEEKAMAPGKKNKTKKKKEPRDKGNKKGKEKKEQKSNKKKKNKKKN